MRLSIEQIIKATGGEVHNLSGCDTGKTVSCVVLDSRKIKDGGCFIATPGERVDGHDFIPQVIEKGAACILCQRIPEGIKGCFIIVPDSFAALTQIAAEYRAGLNIPFVGIVGSVGKTSTKEYIASVLSQHFSVHKTAGNYNNEIGVPQTILEIPDSAEVAVLEMGINHFGEMRRLSALVKPDVVVMTNIGECHLEFLKDREGVLAAKSEVFENISSEGYVFINGDDDMLRTIEVVRNKKPVSFGLEAENAFKAEDLVPCGFGGYEFTLKSAQFEQKLRTRLPGLHMVRNALAAAAIGAHFGLSAEEIQKGVLEAGAVGGRSRIIEKNGWTIIDDSYNANPTSVKAALDLLAAAEEPTIAILGDMGELGDGAAAYHRQIGAYAVQKKISGLICIGSLSKHMYQGSCHEKEISLLNTIVQYYPDTESFIERMKTHNKPFKGVNLLIKASHFMGFDRIVKFFEED